MESMTGQLLVATPTLKDPNFDRTVVLLVAHESGGALGVVLNRATEVPVADPAFRGLAAELRRGRPGAVLLPRPQARPGGGRRAAGPARRRGRGRPRPPQVAAGGADPDRGPTGVRGPAGPSRARPRPGGQGDKHVQRPGPQPPGRREPAPPPAVPAARRPGALQHPVAEAGARDGAAVGRGHPSTVGRRPPGRHRPRVAPPTTPGSTCRRRAE